MTRRDSKSGAGLFSYEGRGEPEGKHQSDNKAKSELLGENLPGYGAQPEHVWGEVEKRRTRHSQNSAAPEKRRPVIWVFTLSILVVLAFVLFTYLHFAEPHHLI